MNKNYWQKGYANDMQKSKNLINPKKLKFVNADYCPLISVLVLCYKNRALLNGMLKSIAMQKYPNIQLIVSDDGSSDFYVDEVKKYIASLKADNIREIIVRKNKENIGTVRHIREALSLAKGEYIIFTAADDRFQNENVFTNYANLFEKNKDKVWLVASCNILTPDYKRSIYITPTKVDKPYFESGDAKLLFSRWSRRGMAIPCCMAFRRKAFDIVGGIDLEYNYLEDWPLVLKLLRNGYAPIYISEVSALHSAGGVTNSNARYGIDVRKKFFDDKELVYQKEVKPYLNLLSQEDLSCLKAYRKEINQRQYFLSIYWPMASKIKKIMYILNPQYLFWILEIVFDKYEKYLRKPLIFLASQICFLVSALFSYSSVGTFRNMVFDWLSYIYFCIGIVLFIFAVLLIPFRFYVYKKRLLRKNLVN